MSDVNRFVRRTILCCHDGWCLVGDYDGNVTCHDMSICLIEDFIKPEYRSGGMYLEFAECTGPEFLPLSDYGDMPTEPIGYERKVIDWQQWGWERRTIEGHVIIRVMATQYKNIWYVYREKGYGHSFMKPHICYATCPPRYPTDDKVVKGHILGYVSGESLVRHLS